MTCHMSFLVHIRSGRSDVAGLLLGESVANFHERKTVVSLVPTFFFISQAKLRYVERYGIIAFSPARSPSGVNRAANISR